MIKKFLKAQLYLFIFSFMVSGSLWLYFIMNPQEKQILLSDEVSPLKNLNLVYQQIQNFGNENQKQYDAVNKAMEETYEILPQARSKSPPESEEMEGLFFDQTSAETQDQSQSNFELGLLKKKYQEMQKIIGDYQKQQLLLSDEEIQGDPSSMGPISTGIPKKLMELKNKSFFPEEVQTHILNLDKKESLSDEDVKKIISICKRVEGCVQRGIMLLLQQGWLLTETQIDLVQPFF